MNRTDRRAIVADLADLITRAADAGLPTVALQAALDELKEASSPSSSNIAVRKTATERFQEARRILRGIPK